MTQTDKATPRPWTLWEIKSGSTRTERELEKAVKAVNAYDDLLNACKCVLGAMEEGTVNGNDLHFELLYLLKEAIANATK